MAAGSTQGARLNISDDRLRISLVPAQNDPSLLTSEAVIAQLRELSIPLTAEVTKAIEEKLTKIQAKSNEPVVVVEGCAPVAGVGVSFQPVLPPDAAKSKDQRSDWHRSMVITTAAGECIGTLSPGVAPVDGRDVYGKAIPAFKAFSSIHLGKNVRLDADGRSVIAAVAGKVNVARDELSVIEVVDIQGDVDYSTGNVHAPSDILIKGTVRESFEVLGKQSVTIKGAIEAATVQAGTDVHVQGGITAHGNGRVVAGGTITARFCNSADLQAGGDVIMLHEASNSRIHAGGRLDVSSGAVIGGYAYARGGGCVKELGNDANIVTEIAIGADPVLVAEADEAQKDMKKKRDTIQMIRDKVGPLMAIVKQLSPQQREKATELLCQADEMEMEVNELQKKREAALAATSFDAWPVLEIRVRVYPRVRVVFGNKETTFTKECRGPVKIVRRLVENVEEIVMLDPISGSVTVLPSRTYARKAPSPS
jgi:uncharacterized protein